LPPISRDDDSNRERHALVVHARAMSTVASSKPTIEVAKEMPREFHEMSDKMIMRLAVGGNYKACKERMVREVRAVNGVDYATATSTVDEMSSANRSANAIYKLPYNLGITLAIGAGLASFPLVFDINTALWFNEAYVTADVAPDEDLETALEVGSWTWAWMEPPLGQISFFLLCMAWSRENMKNVNISPYTEWMKAKRAASLADKFPQYNETITKEFAEADMFR
jgi:hypothetical protein